MRDALKATARGVALVLVLPALLSYAIRSKVLGPDRALEGSTQFLALIPGLTGRVPPPRVSGAHDCALRRHGDRELRHNLLEVRRPARRPRLRRRRLPPRARAHRARRAHRIRRPHHERAPDARHGRRRRSRSGSSRAGRRSSASAPAPGSAVRPWSWRMSAATPWLARALSSRAWCPKPSWPPGYRRASSGRARESPVPHTSSALRSQPR